jgi:hypothetical protein
MEESEVELENAEENIHEAAHKSPQSWVSWVALGSVIFAVLAAITALLSNHHANEAMIKQVKASDEWTYYQAKGIKAGLLASKMELLDALGKPVSDTDKTKLGQYKTEQDEILASAKETEEESASHLRHHVVLSRGVTLFQIAIGVAAISALTRRKRFWFVSGAFALVGAGFLIQGLWFV